MAVDWLDLIQTDFVNLQKTFANKDEVLELLADQLSRSPKLSKCTRKEILEALRHREGQGSTGLGGGIAAPHCGLKNADGFGIVIVTLAEGIDFGSFDSIPCNFIISIVGPEQERSQHVQILASLASGLQKVEEVQALLACKDQGQAMGILGEIFSVDFGVGITPGDGTVKPRAIPAEPPTGQAQQSRLTIIIQTEKFFMPLLEEAVRASAGAVSVLEGNNVTEYLRRMPLYAYVLNAQKLNKFLRCIEAVVPNTELQSVYETIRRIHKKIEKNPGVLVFHQEIHGILGSLDY